MALTPSNMLALGTKAPEFALHDTEGNIVRYSDFSGAPGKLIMFICNHCPYVKHIKPALVTLAQEYMPRGVAILAINSNDAGKYPEDGPDKMRLEKEQMKYPFPYLYDETQEVAKSFEAACTPDFFLFDHSDHLVYRGQFDSSRPGNGIPVSGGDLRRAMECVLEGQPVSEEQTPSIGCNIKWKDG